MKRIVSTLTIIAVALSVSACAKPMTICGVTYGSYGLLDQDDKKNPDIQYEVVWGNVVWAAILVETIIAPIYFGGFSLFQPVGLKPGIKGSITPTPQECPPPKTAERTP